MQATHRECWKSVTVSRLDLEKGAVPCTTCCSAPASLLAGWCCVVALFAFSPTAGRSALSTASAALALAYWDGSGSRLVEGPRSVPFAILMLLNVRPAAHRPITRPFMKNTASCCRRCRRGREAAGCGHGVVGWRIVHRRPGWQKLMSAKAPVLDDAGRRFSTTLRGAVRDAR